MESLVWKVTRGEGRLPVVDLPHGGDTYALTMNSVIFARSSWPICRFRSFSLQVADYFKVLSLYWHTLYVYICSEHMIKLLLIVNSNVSVEESGLTR
jgi:hypothetical protein